MAVSELRGTMPVAAAADAAVSVTVRPRRTPAQIAVAAVKAALDEADPDGEQRNRVFRDIMPAPDKIGAPPVALVTQIGETRLPTLGGSVATEQLYRAVIYARKVRHGDAADADLEKRMRAEPRVTSVDSPEIEVDDDLASTNLVLRVRDFSILF